MPIRSSTLLEVSLGSVLGSSFDRNGPKTLAGAEAAILASCCLFSSALILESIARNSLTMLPYADLAHSSMSGLVTVMSIALSCT